MSAGAQVALCLPAGGANSQGSLASWTIRQETPGSIQNLERLATVGGFADDLRPSMVSCVKCHV